MLFWLPEEGFMEEVTFKQALRDEWKLGCRAERVGCVLRALWRGPGREEIKPRKWRETGRPGWGLDLPPVHLT